MRAIAHDVRRVFNASRRNESLSCAVGGKTFCLSAIMRGSRAHTAGLVRYRACARATRSRKQLRLVPPLCAARNVNSHLRVFAISPVRGLCCSHRERDNDAKATLLGLRCDILAIYRYVPRLGKHSTICLMR